MSGLQVIGVASGFSGPDSSTVASIVALAEARIAQIMVNRLENNLLLGLNEQVSCGNCGGAGVGMGSFAVSGHGRYALAKEWTLLGGVDIGSYKQKGADVPLNVGFAGALQYDPAGMGASRPYAEVGVTAGLQNARYSRTYGPAASPMTGVGSSRNYDVSVDAQVGWVDRITPRDEGAVYVDYSRSWQFVGAYAEQAGPNNPIAAAMPRGTDIMDVAGLNAQYTHLFGSRVEADVNGGVSWAFSAKSGLLANVEGYEVPGGQPSFVYYGVGGRVGYRVNSRLTLDGFVNGILAPRAIGSSAHGGIDLRWNF
jgi:hypothetical protein